MTFITNETARDELLAIWNANTNELVDAFIAAGVDPDRAETSTAEIRAVIVAWIESGDECASA